LYVSVSTLIKHYPKQRLFDAPKHLDSFYFILLGFATPRDAALGLSRRR